MKYDKLLKKYPELRKLNKSVREQCLQEVEDTPMDFDIKERIFPELDKETKWMLCYKRSMREYTNAVKTYNEINKKYNKNLRVDPKPYFDWMKPNERESLLRGE